MVTIKEMITGVDWGLNIIIAILIIGLIIYIIKDKNN